MWHSHDSRAGYIDDTVAYTSADLEDWTTLLVRGRLGEPWFPLEDGLPGRNVTWLISMVVVFVQ